MKEKAQELKVEKENIVVLGSSVTDLSMAENAGKFIVCEVKDASVREKADILMEEFEVNELLKGL